MILPGNARYNRPMRLGKHRFQIVLVLLILALASLAYLSFHPDDYYIYQQYARNLKANGEFAFNPGQPSYGFTSPLWLMALGAGFNPAQPHLFPKILSFILYALAIFLFRQFSRKKFGQEGALTGTLLLFLNPWVLRWSLSGMETTAALLTAILLLHTWIKGDSRVWIPLGLLPLFRPELLVWTLLAMLYLVWKRRYLTALLSLLPTVAWHGAAFLIFGQLFPNTAYAKAAGFSLSAGGYALKKTLLTLQPADWVALALLLILLLSPRRPDSRTLMVFCFCLVLPALFALKGVKVHTRYLVPLFPLTVFLLLFATRQRLRLRRVVLVISLAVSVFQTVYWVLPATRAYARSEKSVNLMIGRYLREHTPENSRVFLWDIGAIAFVSGRRTIDLNGLVDRTVFHRNQPYPLLVAREMRNSQLPFYLVDVHRREKRALGTIPGIRTEFLFSRPFVHMFIFQDKPLFYSLYRLIPDPAG